MDAGQHRHRVRGRDLPRGIEDYKVWLARQPGNKGALPANTHRQRLQTLRAFFERIIEWDWPDAPPRNPVIGGDIPKKPEPRPKFPGDRDAARLMAAARACPDPRDRLVIELLARTGMRAGELADLEADAVVRIGEAYWLRIPLGKLRNDRYVPLHPDLIQLTTEWTAANLAHIRAHRRLAADHRGPLDRHMIGRIVRRVGRRAGPPICAATEGWQTPPAAAHIRAIGAATADASCTVPKFISGLACQYPD